MISKNHLRIIAIFSVLSLASLGTFAFASNTKTTNLLSDSQSMFEKSINGWEPQGNTTLSHEVFAKRSGSAALLARVDEKGPWPDSSKTARFGTSQYVNAFSAKANARYEGSVYIRGFDGSTGNARCEIREYNGQKIIATHTNIKESKISPDWVQLTCVAQLSSTAKQVALRVHVSGAEYGSRYLVDDAFLGLASEGVETTQPPVTNPPVTQPPATQPPVTKPPVTQPPVTQPPVVGMKPKPDASNTGVKQGIKLEKSSTIVVTTNGAVIENKEVAGMIQVKANNVTIKNVHIIGNARNAIRMERGFSNLLMEDITISSNFKQGEKTQYGIEGIYGEGSWTLRRGNISGFADGAKLHSNQLIEDSYFHDNARIANLAGVSNHTDGLQTSGGSNVTIRNNHFKSSYPNDFAMGSNLMIQNEFAQVRNYVIENNYFSGGNYTVYLNSSKSNYGPHENIIIRNNVWAKNTQQYGLLYVGGSNNDFRFSGNVYDDGTPFDGTPFRK